MSARIIPFPAQAPNRADIDAGVKVARKYPGMADTAERRAYVAGFIAGMIKAGSSPQTAHG